MNLHRSHNIDAKNGVCCSVRRGTRVFLRAGFVRRTTILRIYGSSRRWRTISNRFITRLLNQGTPTHNSFSNVGLSGWSGYSGRSLGLSYNEKKY